MTVVKNLSNSNNGQKASQWGPIIWNLLITLSYYWDQYNPKIKKKELFIELIECYLNVLYCKFCRHSMQDFYFINSIRRSSLTVFEWILWLHQKVNEKLYKPQFPKRLVIQHFILPEWNYWILEEVSDQWKKYYWISLYLLAINFPNQIFTESDKLKQTSTIQFVKIIKQLIPKSDFSHREMEQKESSMMCFESRQNLFKEIYRQETFYNNKSLFGSNIEAVALYFETSFRSS